MKTFIFILVLCFGTSHAKADLFESLQAAEKESAKDKEKTQVGLGVDDRHIASTLVKRSETKVITVESSITADNSADVAEEEVEDEQITSLDAAIEDMASLRKELSDKSE